MIIAIPLISILMAEPPFDTLSAGLSYEMFLSEKEMINDYLLLRECFLLDCCNFT